MNAATANKIGCLTIASYVICFTLFSPLALAEDSAANPQNQISEKIQPVFCVTNRAAATAKSGTKPDPLQYARYELNIRPQHHPGNLDDITVRSTKAAKDLDSLCHDIQQDPRHNRSRVLVFVHGFNVTSDESIRRAAQIATELDHDGLVFVFSWPSLGHLSQKAYLADRKMVDESIAAFRQFLLAVDRKFGGMNIQVLAHSLGCRLVSQTMASIVQAEAGTAESKLRLANVVLAAPDVDAQYFEKTYAPALTTVVRRVTVYYSRSDVALAFSKAYNDKQDRLGSVGSPRSDIETVDYSALGGFLLAHGYYREHPVMLKDLRGVLANTIPPSRRQFLADLRGETGNAMRKQPKPNLETSHVPKEKQPVRRVRKSASSDSRAVLGATTP